MVAPSKGCSLIATAGIISLLQLLDCINTSDLMVTTDASNNLTVAQLGLYNPTISTGAISLMANWLSADDSSFPSYY